MHASLRTSAAYSNPGLVVGPLNESGTRLIRISKRGHLSSQFQVNPISIFRDLDCFRESRDSWESMPQLSSQRIVCLPAVAPGPLWAYRYCGLCRLSRFLHPSTTYAGLVALLFALTSPASPRPFSPRPLAFNSPSLLCPRPSLLQQYYCTPLFHRSERVANRASCRSLSRRATRPHLLFCPPCFITCVL